MFARVKKFGKHHYLQIVENYKEKGKVKQCVIATVGRMDQLQSKGRIETLIRSLSKFSKQALLIISEQSEITADAQKNGPPLIFERLWKETSVKAAKVLWQVEKVFRDIKSLLNTCSFFLKRDATIRGHVFCNFLALVLRKELDQRLSQAGHRFEWAAIKQDLTTLQLVAIEEEGRRLCIRSLSKGVCGKVFQAVGVAMPPTIQSA